MISASLPDRGIFVQDEVRGMKQTKGTLEVLLGVVGA